MINTEANAPMPNRRTVHKYRLVRSTEGVDNTFEVETTVTKNRIAWVGYWDEVANAKRAARKVAAFLEAVANDEVQLDLEALIEELKHIAVDWGFRELRQARPEWSDAKVWSWAKEYRYYHGNDIGYPAGLVETLNRSDP